MEETYPFATASGTVEHDEFVGTEGNTIAVSTSADLEFEILSVDGLSPGTVTHTRPYPEMGDQYEDMVITTTANSFTYASKFDFTFKRITKYLYQPVQTEEAKEYYQVISPHLLPPDDPDRPQLEVFNGIYHLIPPSVEQVPVVFTVNGRERTIGEEGGGGGTVYGDWYAKSYQWTVLINHNFSWTAYAIKKAVQDGTGYKKALEQYPEIALDPVTPP